MAKFIVEDTSLAEVADAIRAKSGTSNSLTFPEGFADAIDSIETGSGGETPADSYYDLLWERLQQSGNRTSYDNTFNGSSINTAFWCLEIFLPKYPIVPTSANGMFRGIESADGSTYDLQKHFEEKNIILDFSKCTNLQYCFRDHSNIERFCKIDVSSATNAYGMFYQSGGAKESAEICELKFTEETNLSSLFLCAYRITRCNFIGKITTSQSLSYTPFDAYSGRSIISCLTNYAETDKEYTNALTLNTATWTALNADTSNLPPNGNSWEEYVESLGWTAAG